MYIIKDTSIILNVYIELQALYSIVSFFYEWLILILLCRTFQSANLSKTTQKFQNHTMSINTHSFALLIGCCYLILIGCC